MHKQKYDFNVKPYREQEQINQIHYEITKKKKKGQMLCF